MDLVLPGISGAEAAEKLREAGILPSTPLILTTALGDDDARYAARSIGATDLLLKPFDIGTMLASVHAALLPSAHTPPSQQVASGS
jgi:two-component system OmpR family response regulator